MPPEAFRWMNAEGWNTSSDLWQMLHNAEQKTGDQRKMSLFGTACCRRHWALLIPESQAILIEFESLLDRISASSRSDVLKAGHSLNHRANSAVGLVPSSNHATGTARIAAAKAVCYAVLGSPWGAYGYFQELDPSEVLHQVEFLRDIFGNPFRPVPFSPAWRTDTAIALASQMYESREFSAMPILADALQDAGCNNEDILSHCRDAKQTHVRGCWVVDLVLGKQ